MAQPAPISPEPSRRTFWSTRLVAKRLKVSEATVKRWSDDGLLSCYRTPGGHRKFSPQDVSAFVATRHFDPERGVGAQTGRSDDALALMVAGDTNELFALSRRLLGNGVPLENLLDEVFTRALVELGERWACGSLGVADEHTASSTVIATLSRLEPLVSARAMTGSAVSACLSGERHDIAARMAALLLMSRGFRCATPGADVPADSLAQLIRQRNATVVTLSASAASVPAATLESELSGLLRHLRGVPVRVFVGGSAFAASTPALPGTTRIANMRTLAAALAT